MDVVAGTTPQDYSSVSYGSGTIVSALCTGLGTGTGMGTRVGNRICVHKVKGKYAFQAGDNVNNLRVVFFSFKKPVTYTSVANLVSSVFCGNASASTQYTSPIDERLVTVYHDSMHSLWYAPVDGSTATSVSHYKNLDVEFKPNRIIEWDAWSSTSALPNDIYLLMISDSGVVANPGCTAGYTQFWYTDSL